MARNGFALGVSSPPFNFAAPPEIGGGTPAAGNFTTLTTTLGFTAGGAIKTTVDVLTDGATIATNAALGNYFSVTLASSRTMAAPTNPVAGQLIVFEITQGGAGTCLITWDAVFDFTVSVPEPVLSTTVAKVDLIHFRYIGGLSKWRCVATCIDD